MRPFPAAGSQPRDRDPELEYFVDASKVTRALCRRKVPSGVYPRRSRAAPRLFFVPHWFFPVVAQLALDHLTLCDCERDVMKATNLVCLDGIN